ncbi:MAG: FG-GAP repeat protein, partial [Planctomycetes bacterium]|nr:FG-GAP repeat protein [Planctomycetota bacterium]
AAGGLFGEWVAASGNAVIVGAWRHAEGIFNETGAAYVYQFDGLSWSEEAKILASDRSDNDFFGRAVALDANVAGVGAYGVDDNGPTSGAIYLYRRAGVSWFEEAKLHASDYGAGDRFGVSVALSGDVVIAGAFTDDDLGSNSGSAEVFLGPNGFDCNNNGVSDACDILYGLSFDGNGDGIPDECACILDMDSSGSVDVPDLLVLLAAWGTDPGGPPDFDNDGLVGVPDLLALLSNWGPCP